MSKLGWTTPILSRKVIIHILYIPGFTVTEMTNPSTFIHGKYFRILCSKMSGLWLSHIQRSLQNPQHTSSSPPGCSSPKCYAPGPNLTSVLTDQITHHVSFQGAQEHFQHFKDSNRSLRHLELLYLFPRNKKRTCMSLLFMASNCVHSCSECGYVV